MEFDQQFVEYIVKALVNHPEEVTSVREEDDRGILIIVRTAPADAGYAIGKGGRNAEAIRTLLAPISAKQNMRVSFRIEAPENDARRAPSEEMPAAPAPAAIAPEAPMDDATVDSLTF